MASSKAVGKLWVGLDMEASGFKRGLDKSESAMKQSAGRMKGIFGSVFSGAMLGNLAAAGITRILGSIRNTITSVFDRFENLDAIAKFSRQINISSESLIAWKQAAELAGTGGDTLQKGLEKLSINLGYAADKGGPIADAIKALNLDARMLANIKLDKAFLQIADAISKENNAIQRAYLTSLLFGKAGPKIALMMEGGAKSLEDAIESARKDGILFSEDQLARIERANDAMTMMRDKWAAAKDELAIGIAPLVKVIADDLKDAFGSMDAAEGGGIVGLFESLSDVIYTIGQGLQALFGVVQFGVGVLIGGIDTAIQAIGQAIDSIMPDAIQPQWITDLAKNGTGLNAAGQAIADKGSANMQGAWDSFIRLTPSERAEAERRRKAGGGKDTSAPEQPASVSPNATPAATLIRGTQEAYSAIAKFRMSGETNEEIQKQQREELRKQTAEQEKMQEKLDAVVDYAQRQYEGFKQWWKKGIQHIQTTSIGM